MLHLVSATDPSWADRAAAAVDTVLLDHAHCEKKAASTALSLVFRYPEVPGLAPALSAIAREELDHFERVLALLARRGLPFRRLPPSPYAARLAAAVRTFEPARLLDTLLCCALIEARSCERMLLLSRRLEDPEPRALYEGLLESEARHHAAYADMARGTGLFAEEEVRERLRELSLHEAAVLHDLPVEPRMHNR
jgi:tRNA-(ms[2]io[6]A)-hydroxylase